MTKPIVVSVVGTVREDAHITGETSFTHRYVQIHRGRRVLCVPYAGDVPINWGDKRPIDCDPENVLRILPHRIEHGGGLTHSSIALAQNGAHVLAIDCCKPRNGIARFLWDAARDGGGAIRYESLNWFKTQPNLVFTNCHERTILVSNVHPASNPPDFDWPAKFAGSHAVLINSARPAAVESLLEAVFSSPADPLAVMADSLPADSKLPDAARLSRPCSFGTAIPPIFGVLTTSLPSPLAMKLLKHSAVSVADVAELAHFHHGVKGSHLDYPGVRLPDPQIVAAGAWLLRQAGGPAFITTDGDHGCMLWQRDQPFATHILPGREAIDLVTRGLAANPGLRCGAGDRFVGHLLAAWFVSRDWSAAALAACRRTSSFLAGVELNDSLLTTRQVRIP